MSDSLQLLFSANFGRVQILLLCSIIRSTSNFIMAHLISVPGINYLDSDCIIKVPLKQVIVSRLRRKLRVMDEDPICESSGEEQQIMNVCKKLSEQENTRIRKETEMQLNQNFQKMKRKMRASVKSKQSLVAKFFDSKQNDEPRLSSLLKNYPQRIDINQKHCLKIQGRLSCVRQAKSIQNCKTKYNTWLNSNNNSPMKSPNFTKMNFVLEKINDKKDLNEILRPIRFSHNQKNTWTSSISKVTHVDYTPKKRHPLRQQMM